MDVFKGLLAVGSVVEKILLNIRRSLMHRNSEAVTVQRLPDFLQRKAVQHRLAELGGDLRQMPDAFRGALTEGRLIRKIKDDLVSGGGDPADFPDGLLENRKRQIVGDAENGEKDGRDGVNPASASASVMSSREKSTAA